MIQAHKTKLILIIPAYNAEVFLFDLFASLNDFVRCNSDNFSIKIYIVSDGSTDNTLSKCSKLNELFFSDHAAEVVILSKQNGGLSSARNYGISAAKTDQSFDSAYILFLDVDDVLLPVNLERNIDLVADLNIYLCAISSEKRPRKLVKSVSNALSLRNPLVISQVIIKSKVITDFDETRTSLEDWDFWIRTILINKATEKHHQKVLTLIRSNYYSMSSNLGRMRENRRIIGMQYKNNERLSKKEKKNFLLHSLFRENLGLSDILNIAIHSFPRMNRIFFKAIKDYFDQNQSKSQPVKPFILTAYHKVENLPSFDLNTIDIDFMGHKETALELMVIVIDSKNYKPTQFLNKKSLPPQKLTNLVCDKHKYLVFKTWALSVALTNKIPKSRKDWLIAYSLLNICDIINKNE